MCVGGDLLVKRLIEHGRLDNFRICGECLYRLRLKTISMPDGTTRMIQFENTYPIAKQDGSFCVNCAE